MTIDELQRTTDETAAAALEAEIESLEAQIAE
jgi:hypothetical protein